MTGQRQAARNPAGCLLAAQLEWGTGVGVWVARAGGPGNGGEGARQAVAHAHTATPSAHQHCAHSTRYTFLLQPQQV